MKKHFIYLILLISATLIYGCSYAAPAADSLPPCIIKMKQKDSLLIVDKYDYKGQRWYGISRKTN
jgi:PBP1b-binding outer membrane lipoprotein LpoB